MMQMIFFIFPTCTVLTKYMKPRKIVKERNLLSTGQEEPVVEPVEEAEVCEGFWLCMSYALTMILNT